MSVQLPAVSEVRKPIHMMATLQFTLNLLGRG